MQKNLEKVGGVSYTRRKKLNLEKKYKAIWICVPAIETAAGS